MAHNHLRCATLDDGHKPSRNTGLLYSHFVFILESVLFLLIKIVCCKTARGSSLIKIKGEVAPDSDGPLMQCDRWPYKVRDVNADSTQGDTM